MQSFCVPCSPRLPRSPFLSRSPTAGTSFLLATPTLKRNARAKERGDAATAICCKRVHESPHDPRSNCPPLLSLRSSPQKKQIYDTYGWEGLNAGMELGPHLRTRDEIRAEFERKEREKVGLEPRRRSPCIAAGSCCFAGVAPHRIGKKAACA